MTEPKKSKPSPIEIYAAETLAEGGPALVRAEELDAKGGRTYVTARHATVEHVLREEATFSLQHYDELLAEIAGNLRFLLGVDSPERQDRLAMMLAAQSQVSKWIGAGPPTQDSVYLDWIASTARKQAQQVIRILRKSRGPGGQVNLIREYGYLVTYLTAKQVFGIPGPDKPPMIVKVMMFLRNFFAKGPWVRMKGELGSAMSMFGLYHLIFGHLFGAGKGAGVLAPLAKIASKSYLKILGDVNAGKLPIPPHSLQAAFGAVRGDFARIKDETYWAHVSAIQYELVSAMTLLVGTAFGRMAGLLVAPEGPHPGIDWNGALSALDTVGRSGQAGHDIIGELLRLSRGTQLMRTVVKPVELEGIALQPGDRILTINDAANFDPRVFADPYQYRLGRAGSPLIFGAVPGPHSCYGQFIARTMLREMMLVAGNAMQPVEDAELISFLFMPDDLAFEIKPDATLGLFSNVDVSPQGDAR
jgi:Cytochrome P450